MKFVRIAVGSLALFALPAASSAMQSTPEQAALSQCVSMRTSGSDRILTARWVFAAMTVSPHIADLSAMSEERKSQIDKEFAQLLTRIVVKDCLNEMRPLAEENWQGAFELAGRALGEVAMQELMGNERVDKAIGDYADYLAEEDFKPLLDSLPSDLGK